MSQLGTIASVDVWLLIFVGVGIIAAYEIGAIISHRWHTISWFAHKYRWLAWLIGGLFLASGLGLFLWFVFYHTKHWIPW